MGIESFDDWQCYLTFLVSKTILRSLSFFFFSPPVFSHSKIQSVNTAVNCFGKGIIGNRKKKDWSELQFG